MDGNSFVTGMFLVCVSALYKSINEDQSLNADRNDCREHFVHLLVFVSSRCPGIGSIILFLRLTPDCCGDSCDSCEL